MTSKLALATVIALALSGSAFAQGTRMGGGDNGASSSADVKNSDVLQGKGTKMRSEKHMTTGSSMRMRGDGGGDNGASSSADVKNSDRMQGKAAAH